MLRSLNRNLAPVVVLLTERLRCVTPEQLYAWQHGTQQSLASFRRALQPLLKAQWLALRPVMAHPPLTATPPLHTWQTGDPEPPFDRLAHLAQRRWTRPAQQTQLLTATSKACGLSGAALPRTVRTREINHDLLLAAAYGQMSATEPALAVRWAHEDSYACRQRSRELGDLRPDALVLGPRPLAIDCIGKYDARKLRRLHSEYAEAFGAYRFY